MTISELQDDIIKQLLKITDLDTLTLFKEALAQKTDNITYALSDFEKRIIQESRADYEQGNIIDNEVIFQRNKKWLEE